MNYKACFNTLLNRSGTASEKWNFPNKNLPSYVTEPPLPMWVADMDFKSPPAVLDALKNAVDFGIFGYTDPWESLLEAVVSWQQRRHNWKICASWITFSPGVVTALGHIIDALTKPGDSILIQPPVYGPFKGCPESAGRRIVTAPLVDCEDHYAFDAEQFEKAIRSDTKLFILCNPHNPVGKIWTKDELRQMGDICLRHGVIIIADEIHQDFTFSKNHPYTPYASLGEKYSTACVTLTAPSKTFNIAGLQTSIIITENPTLRAEIQRAFNRSHVTAPNMLGLIACEAAYRHGEAWLDALLSYLQENRTLIEERLRGIPGIQLYKADSLYLAWIDFKQTGLSAPDLKKHLLVTAKVWLDDGLKFGAEYGTFGRLNFGCPRETLEEGLSRIANSMVVK